MGKGSGGVMKPKLPQSETPNQIRDDFQTPRYATGLILRFVPSDVDVIWECCSGEGRMADVICEWLASGQSINWLVYRTDPRDGGDMFAKSPYKWDCAITNPPYSIKKKVYRRLISLGKPFALLIPGDWSGWLVKAITPIERGGDGCRIVLPDRRINYITPSGKSGKKSSSQFHSIWLTRYFNVPDVVHVVHLAKEDLENI